MFDWFKKLFAEPQTLGVIATSGILGFLVGIAQGTIQKRHGGWPGFFAAITVAPVVSILIGLAISGYVSSEVARLAIVGICAIVSEDIWFGLKTLGMGIRSDPLGFVARVIDALRGRPSPSSLDGLLPDPKASLPSGQTPGSDK
jgi:hypothetical protein